MLLLNKKHAIISVKVQKTVQEEITMFYQSELSFLCDVFKKSHLGTHVIALSELQSVLSDSDKTEFFEHREPLWDRLPTMEPHTVYRLTDSFELCYRFLLLPDTDIPTVFYFGPFLNSPFSQKRLLEIGEQHGISPQKQRYLTEYYTSLPVLPDGCHLLTMFSTLCERIWHTPAYRVINVTAAKTESDKPVSRSMRNLTASDTLLNIKALERRYAFENEMIRAVSLGQTHTESQFRSAFSIKHFEKRNTDPLRNAKNYGIIMNTLLRKAAERGGVHPFQIDQISSEFANRIESLRTLADSAPLMIEMFRSYCRLTRNHAIQKYSPIVQKSILIIDADLSADLSPSLLANTQSVSLGYLSTVFRKETGMTISAYVREQRMKYAAYLLETTKLQIQTVAMHCGIMDVQYFSKLFKKHHQKTPTEYREAHVFHAI